jgi:hypothetical protein
MESEEKILVWKLDNMLKHVGHHKATILGPCKVKVASLYSKITTNMHVMKESTQPLSVILLLT